MEVLRDHPAQAWLERRKSLHEARYMAAILCASQAALLLILTDFSMSQGQEIFLSVMTLGYASAILMLTVARRRMGSRPDLSVPLTDADAMRLLWWAERLEAREILVDITTKSGSICYGDADYVMKEVMRRAPRKAPIDVVAIRAAAGI